MTGKTYTDQGVRIAGALKASFLRPDSEWGGWFDIGNSEECQLTPKSKQVNRVSYLEGSAGSNLSTAFINEPMECAIKFDHLGAENMALAHNATLSRNIITTAATITDEAHTAWHNEQIRLKNKYVSNVVISTPTAGTGALYTTDNAGYAIGTKTINLITGTGTILAGDTVTFAGDSTLYAVKSFTGGVLTLMAGLKKAIPAAATDMTIRAAIATLSATTDYIQDDRYGHYIKILDTGLIADGGKVLVDYSHKGSIKDVIAVGVQPNVVMRFELNGINLDTGKRCSLFVGYATFTSDGGFNWFSQDYLKGGVTGIANIDQDSTSKSYGNAAVIDWNEEVID